MAQQRKISTIVTVLVITMATRYGGVMAQFSGCAAVITSLPSCAGFIAGSTLTAPPGCCTEFASVIESRPLCLCQVFNATSSFMGLSGLPKLCNVNTPSECNASPSDSPSGTTPSPSDSPSGTTPAPGTNATSPSANSPPPPSGATLTRYTTFPVLCLLLVAAYAMVF